MEAITHSINVIPVKLSIELGNGNPKLGRAMIVQTARNFGIHAPLPDTPSLPIGADEVYVYEHAVAYATFPNLGTRRGAACRARSAHRHRPIGLALRPRRSEAEASDSRRKSRSNMIKMMNSVVENGTGKRAQLDGIKAAGKTGTTNSWRDAWFVGYTGNFVGAVWMGNDDYSPTKRMTGGTLPAMTWHNIMAYAHQGIELRPLPGLPPPEHAPTMTDTSFKGSEEPHPALLTRKGTDALIQVEHMLDDANHALAAQGAPGPGVARCQPTSRNGVGNGRTADRCVNAARPRGDRRAAIRAACAFCSVRFSRC